MLMKKERNISMTTPSVSTKNNKVVPYRFFYWGPLLCRMKLQPKDLEECTALCNKKSSSVAETLAGVIKEQHYVSTHKYARVLDHYLRSFRQSFNHWYGYPLTKGVTMIAAWVNFMTAGEFNPPHVHTKCDFSSVLFIQLPKALKEEHQKYEGTGEGPGGISFSYGETQPYSLSYRSFFPEEGDLFIFPATLTHFVAPFMAQGERISMSANFKLD
jgi:uncharacterized protein (TIGR02466 family)